MPMKTGARTDMNKQSWTHIKAYADSGANKSTGNANMALTYNVRQSEMSKNGEVFTTADGGAVANEGEIEVPTFIEGPGDIVTTEQVWQTADVPIPLLSVGEECDSDQWVVFTKTSGMILSSATGTVRVFGRNSYGSYEMDMYVPPADPGSAAPV